MVDLKQLLESTINGLGYEFVDSELSNHARLLRVFIDKTGGITVDDCAKVSNHLSRTLAVENINYDRLEVSSPGLDRVLKKPADFARFKGQKAHIKVRAPMDGRRHFTGILGDIREGQLSLDVEGYIFTIMMTNVDKARLVPEINFNAR